MINMSDLIGFVNDLEKILYGLGFKLILKKVLIIDFYRVNAGAGAISNDFKEEINYISRCVSSIDPSNDKRIIVQKGLKQNNVDFNYYERKIL